MPPQTIKGENPHQRDRGRVFTAPLGSARRGRLVFTTGAAGVTILAEPTLRGLIRGRFIRPVSWVGFEQGFVKVGYHADALLRQEVPFDDIRSFYCRRLP